ncbi:hypothetical protein QJS66_17120 [Kocuria rhizophila]|nr:hypothetical protein QJS66_17120 [Kocuria rhizophila]
MATAVKELQARHLVLTVLICGAGAGVQRWTRTSAGRRRCCRWPR